MTGARAVIVGGGRVAARKAALLLSSGLRLAVVSPELSGLLAAMNEDGAIEWIPRKYMRGDLQGAAIAVAATSSRETNSLVAAEAREMRILANVADRPSEGSCTFPALLRRGALEVAVSTGGRSPAMASHVKGIISGIIDEHYGTALELLSEVREKLLTHEDSEKYNISLLRDLMDQGLMEHLRNRDRGSASTLVREALEKLGVTTEESQKAE